MADILRGMRRNNLSARIFDSGLAVSIFRDNSTRTRFSFASACNLLGLTVQDLDEGKSQIAHGETVRETANMVSFMAEVIGIRDDMYIGKGHTYMREVAGAVEQGFADGVLEQRPTLVNLQCDIDHPTQSMADRLHLIKHFGGARTLQGKKIAMTWAYSPSYGKPLSVPQGVIGLMTRFGMDVVLAHPHGYEVMQETSTWPGATRPGRRLLPRVTHACARPSRRRTSSIRRAGRPTRPWRSAPTCYGKGDIAGIKALEKELLAQNAAAQGLGMHREADAGDKGRPRPVHALSAGGHHRRELHGGRGGRHRLRPLPRPALPGGQLQALRHRGDDTSWPR